MGDQGVGPSYGGTENLEVLRDAVNYNRWLLGLVDRGLPPEGRVLDFGAGLGVFAEGVRSTGRVVETLEPEHAHREFLERSGFVVHDTLDGVPPNRFDGAYTLNVLEHIEDDAAAVKQLARVLKPSAPLVVYVPALPVLYSSMDRRVGHHRRYVRGELVRVLKRGGLIVERVEYADVLGIAAALMYRLVGSRAGDLNPTAVKIYDRAVFPLSRRLDRLTSRLLGKNLFAVARVP